MPIRFLTVTLSHINSKADLQFYEVLSPCNLFYLVTVQFHRPRRYRHGWIPPADWYSSYMASLDPACQSTLLFSYTQAKKCFWWPILWFFPLLWLSTIACTDNACSLPTLTFGLILFLYLPVKVYYALVLTLGQLSAVHPLEKSTIPWVVLW